MSPQESQQVTATAIRQAQIDRAEQQAERVRAIERRVQIQVVRRRAAEMYCTYAVEHLRHRAVLVQYVQATPMPPKDPRLKVAGWGLPRRTHATTDDHAQDRHIPRMIAPEGSRFYAQILSGRMECPQCARILQWSGTSGARAVDAKYWNPVTSQLQCSGCLAIYTIGLLAWPSRKMKAQPPDQQPTIRQLAEMRQRAGGVWLPRIRVENTQVNGWVGEECTCSPLPWREGCPVHGRMKSGEDESKGTEHHGEGQEAVRQDETEPDGGDHS